MASVHFIFKAPAIPYWEESRHLSTGCALAYDQMHFVLRVPVFLNREVRLAFEVSVTPLGSLWYRLRLRLNIYVL